MLEKIGGWILCFGELAKVLQMLDARSTLLEMQGLHVSFWKWSSCLDISRSIAYSSFYCVSISYNVHVRRVMACLMEKLGTAMMTEECETPLRQLQHFIARDYKLDPKLYKACHAAAFKYCNAKSVWAGSPLSTDPERGPLILPCLYNRAISPDYKVHLHLTGICDTI